MDDTVAVDDTVAGAGNVFSDALLSSVAKAGTTGDGGNAAVHASYPMNSLKDEYSLVKKALNSVVIAEASFITKVDPKLDLMDIACTETTYGSTKGTGD